MTGIYVRVNDANNDSGISWLGESSPKKFCPRCKVVLMQRENNRTYRCKECGIRQDTAQDVEAVRVDTNVSKLHVKDAIKYVTNDDMITRIRKENHNAIKRRYGLKTLEDEDLGLGNARIIADYDL